MQNVEGLVVSVRYRDTDTEGSSDRAVFEPIKIGPNRKLLGGLEPNTIYRVEPCICKARDCACASIPLTAATKPLGKCIIDIFTFRANFIPHILVSLL